MRAPARPPPCWAFLSGEGPANGRIVAIWPLGAGAGGDRRPRNDQIVLGDPKLSGTAGQMQDRAKGRPWPA